MQKLKYTIGVFPVDREAWLDVGEWMNIIKQEKNKINLMLQNIKFEINTNIISGKETLLKFLKIIKKNTGIIIDKNLYKKSNYIKVFD